VNYREMMNSGTVVMAVPARVVVVVAVAFFFTQYMKFRKIGNYKNAYLAGWQNTNLTEGMGKK